MRKGKKIFPYIVVLKQKKRPWIEYLGILSVLMSILILLQRIFEYPRTRIINVLVVITVSGIFIHSIRNYFTKKGIALMPLYIVVFLALVIIPPFSGFAILFVLLALLERSALTAEEIGFGDEEIVINRLFKKSISWAELNNVILKDGLLTIDFRNDHLIQRETDDNEDEQYDATEEEFNEYCAERLKKIVD